MEYRVVYEQDEDGRWNVRVPDLQGCFTYGRSIRQARGRVREAIAISLDGVSEDEASRIAQEAVLNEEIKLSRKASQAVKAHARAVERSERLARELGRSRRDAVRYLLAAGYSRRDTAEILGISHQRVQQLAG